MDLKTRLCILCENYNYLGRIMIAFKNLPRPYVNNSDLSTFGVQVSQMSFHPEDTIDTGPHFCKPFPADEFDHIFEKAEKPEWHESTLDFNGNFYEGGAFEHLVSEYLGSNRYEWQLLASSKWSEQV